MSPKKKDAKKAMPETEAEEETAEEPVVDLLVGKEEPEKPKDKVAKELAGEPGAMDEEIERELREKELAMWAPRTKLGEMVRKGEVKSLSDVLAMGIPIKEVEIVDSLLPDLEEEIIDVGRVQRVTDSGRRMKFRIVAVIGNKNGYVGIGEAKGKEAGPTIRKAIERAKLNVCEIKRGCGSWECNCGKPHTVPFKVGGRYGSVHIAIMPAPSGVGLVANDTGKKVLSLAGLTDAWVSSDGHTRTTLNLAHALIDALVNTNYIKVKDRDIKNLAVMKGSGSNEK